MQSIEIKAASNFANAFQKHVHMLFLAEEELKQLNLKEKFKKADTELQNLYWIGSHYLNEPLRKIQMFASRIMNEDNAGDFQMIFSSVIRMNDSAKRMQLLVSDILSYSGLSRVEDGLMNVNLNEVVVNVIDELSSEIKNLDAMVTYNELPEVKGVSFFLQQLLVNLLRNSLKFSKIATPPLIEINYRGKVQLDGNESSAERFHKITISDNGIGFDNQFKTSIFKVFTRLHNQNEYSVGSGVGLALCSKIMNNHNEYISANGVPGIGSTISLLFPASIRYS